MKPTNTPDSGDELPQLQISLASMMMLTAIVAAFLGLIMSRQYGIILLIGVIGSLSMMISDVVQNQTYRAGSIGILTAAFLFLIANFVFFSMAMLIDQFSIFSGPYMILALILAPGMLILSAWVIAAASEKFNSSAISGLTIFVCCVAVAHYWILKIFAAGV